MYTWYNTAHTQNSTVQYSTAVKYGTVQCSTAQYSRVRYGTVQYITAHYSTVQYSTVQYSTVQHSIVQHRTPSEKDQRKPYLHDGVRGLGHLNEVNRLFFVTNAAITTITAAAAAQRGHLDAAGVGKDCAAPASTRR